MNTVGAGHLATGEYDGIDYRTVLKVGTDHLRAAILDGRIEPGSRLNQDDIAKQLGVSRTPVREALRILESEGLVNRRPHRGAVVVNLRPEDILETFEIRAMLEARVCELAAPRITDATIAGLHRIFDEMDRTDLNEEHWLELNRDFHTSIYPASGWPRVCALIDAQRNVVSHTCARRSRSWGVATTRVTSMRVFSRRPKTTMVPFSLGAPWNTFGRRRKDWSHSYRRGANQMEPWHR